MTKPRSAYVDDQHARYYHITSRCVRRAWLLGEDPVSGRNYDHRKAVFLNRLRHLSHHFAVQVMGYAIMSNHFHLVVRYDPNLAAQWDDEEVARRWCAVFSGRPLISSHQAATTVDSFSLDQTLRYHELLTDERRLQRCRAALGSLSRFMQHLKQPFAVWVNHEDQCTGHLFEMRFYSGALLDEADLLACMAYVDLNPVEADMARTLRASEHTSVQERLSAQRFQVDALEAYLAPLWEAEPEVADLSLTIKRYVTQLNLYIAYKQHRTRALLDEMDTWMARLVNREREERSGRRRKSPAFFDYAWG